MVRNESKKGLSEMIGYIFLIAAAITISILLFAWMKTYVPKQALECPEGVALTIQESTCIQNISTSKTHLNITLKNTGRFNIAGYLIYYSNLSNEKIPSIDISKNITNSPYLKPMVKLVGTGTDDSNSFKTNEEELHTFEFPQIMDIQLIQIVPVREVEFNNKKNLAACSDARIKELIKCNG